MTVFSHYYQFGIWDKQDNSSYPILNNESNFVFGKKGLIVLLDKEREVEVTINEQINPDINYLLCKSQIDIGFDGIDYGNIPASTIGHYPLTAGLYDVRLFGDNEDKDMAERFHFCLINMGLAQLTLKTE